MAWEFEEKFVEMCSVREETWEGYRGGVGGVVEILELGGSE
jgi:hypothetical protein